VTASALEPTRPVEDPAPRRSYDDVT
jgi:hypothetical protein